MAEKGFKMSALFELIFSLAYKYVELNAWKCFSLINEACSGTSKVKQQQDDGDEGGSVS